MAVYQVLFKLKNLLSDPNGSSSADGEMLVEVHPEWAPIGEKRFRELVETGYFTECRFHRVVSDFIVQWGIPADPQAYLKYGENKIKDDPVMWSNSRGTLSFATSGPNARGSQIFVNFNDNEGLDSQGFSPFAKIVNASTGGMADILRVNPKYARNGPNQQKAKEQGNAYLKGSFPELSYIESATIV